MNAMQILTVLILVYAFFRQWINGKYFSKAHRADGKTVIITGACSGIGKETAIGMAERGARVILTCRNMKKGEEVRSMIIKQTKNTNVAVMYLNLASFQSIRNFAKNILEGEPRLDILINNASVMGVDKSSTDDGLEMHMGVNHYGHFLLTLLLIDRLKESTPSRIITVSNSVHKLVKLDKNNMNSEKSYDRFQAFFHSKLANVLFTKALANRLAGSGVVAISVNPGFFHSDRPNHTGSLLSALCWRTYDIFSKIILRTARSGAQNTLCAALDFNFQNISGVYLDNFSNFTLSQTNPQVNDPELRSWFWDHSEMVTGIQFPEKIV